jgi:hypothetical protein
MKDEPLDLFVQLEAAAEAKKQAEVEAHRQPQQCSHCGDWSPNSCLLSINHAPIFNGWCGRRLWATKRKNADDLAWLEEHGFEVVDPWSVQA